VKRIVIVGATSAIAQHSARVWLQSDVTDLVLVGRDRKRLQGLQQDLTVRKPEATITVEVLNFLDAIAVQKLVKKIAKQGAIDTVLIAHGAMSDQLELQNDIELMQSNVDITAISPALFAEAFAQYFESVGKGTLAVIGSPAGDRARRRNYIYGASKAFVARYTEGLAHRFARTDINVVLIKPGPTATPMTESLQLEGKKLASVEQVAQAIVRGIEAGKTVVYAPGIWKYIMLIIRHIPDVIFTRLNI